jgi:hypothetical protein
MKERTLLPDVEIRLWGNNKLGGNHTPGRASATDVSTPVGDYIMFGEYKSGSEPIMKSSTLTNGHQAKRKFGSSVRVSFWSQVDQILVAMGRTEAD